MAIISVFLWSHSKTVLNYLRNTGTNFGPYILRRCNEIHGNTRVEDWGHISLEINIVDILSHGVSFDKFLILSNWFTGPKFLIYNNQNYNFEGLKGVCDELRIETVEDYESNGNIAYPTLTQQVLDSHQYLRNFICHIPKSKNISHG